MGSMLSAKCACGLKAKVLSGPGVIIGSLCAPAWCQSCQHLVTASTARGKPRCPKCRKAVQVIELSEKPSTSEDGGSGDLVTCPRCGEPALRFTEYGMWD